MKNKLLICLMIGIFLVSLNFVSASCPDGDGCITGSSAIAQNEGIEIYQNCNNCTYCNFTRVKYPNKTVFLSNIEATQDGTYFYYDVLGGNNSELGEYEYCYDCGNAAEKETGCLNYLVTPTGQVFDKAQSTVVFAFIIFLIMLSFMAVYFGLKIDYVPFKIFLVSLGLLFILVTAGVVLNSIKELMILGSVFAATFVNIYRLILILISAGGIGLLVYMIVMSIQQFRHNRGLKEEDDDEDD